MNNFNDRIRESLRRTRLLGLRADLIAGAHVDHGQFAAVFTQTDFDMIDGFMQSYHAATWKLPHALDLCSSGLREYMQASSRTLRDLRLVHKEWRELKATKHLSQEVLEKRFAGLRAQHHSIMLKVKYLKHQRRNLQPADWGFVLDPLLLPDEPVECSLTGVKTVHGLVRRCPWYLTTRHKTDFIGYPKWDVAWRLVHLWQVESHLGMPPSFQDRWSWTPVCVVGP